ncbi:MAG TPA: phosphoribosylglycinamide formyltransferase [Thermoplasmatales archaeon]|nr:phosphoribosylglycinamide formyltransferase [Thermoplasmatales archaeon]
MLKVGVLASGRGTNLQAIIDACEKKLINARVVAVISDNEKAYALERAKKYGIDAYFVDASDKEKHERKMDEILESHDVELVVGAGYMRILSAWFVNKWYGKLINIHPALLPSFKGIDAQRQAIEYGVKIAGCTTHFMDEKPDHGPIILQAAVKVKEDDTRDSLAERILRVEHQILPRSIDLFEQGRLVIEGRRVRILPGDSWLEKYSYPDVLYSEGY